MTTKELPVVFSAQEVRAVLDGRKTQFRRLVKGLRLNIGTSNSNYKVLDTHLVNGELYFLYERNGHKYRHLTTKCPFGEPGTRLWVRETWQYAAKKYCSCTSSSIFYPCDDWMKRTGCKSDRREIVYAAEGGSTKWRSSTTMPRRVSRITIEVTYIRVERLQDISEADAIAEGMQRSRVNYWCGAQHKAHAFPRQMASAKAAYADLWDSKYAKTTPWESNPWIWRVAFRRV